MKRVKVEIATVINVPVSFVYEGMTRKGFDEPIVLEVEVFDHQDESDAREKVREALQRLVDES